MKLPRITRHSLPKRPSPQGQSQTQIEVLQQKEETVQVKTQGEQSIRVFRVRKTPSHDLWKQKHLCKALGIPYYTDSSEKDPMKTKEWQRAEQSARRRAWDRGRGAARRVGPSPLLCASAPDPPGGSTSRVGLAVTAGWLLRSPPAETGTEAGKHYVASTEPQLNDLKELIGSLKIKQKMPPSQLLEV
ncbi:hypothetical protein P7K49_007585 [Saguinus oedipus]|uniref:Uncharacterized protein n=1 Tax=Saguinus oedipus TaxID=9490 RepID=A0ABQ9VWW1_SAGOE|nr:hypothetical protein P7K49_007585 [Saguinus oedipus]